MWHLRRWPDRSMRRQRRLEARYRANRNQLFLLGSILTVAGLVGLVASIGRGVMGLFAALVRVEGGRPPGIGGMALECGLPALACGWVAALGTLLLWWSWRVQVRYPRWLVLRRFRLEREKPDPPDDDSAMSDGRVVWDRELDGPLRRPSVRTPRPMQ